MKKGFKKFSCDENYFEKIDSEDKAYFLGLLIADGYNTGKGFSISLQIEDKYLLEKFKNFIKHTGELKDLDCSKYNKNTKIQSRLHIYNHKISKDLTNLGCIKAKSHYTYFPNIPEELWHHFIRGVFDGDGWITIGKYNSPKFGVVGNIDLITKIQEILIKKCGVNKTKLSHSKKTKENIVSLLYSGRHTVFKIKKYLYKDATIFLTRKNEKMRFTKEKTEHREDCIECGKKYHCNDLCKSCYHKQYIKKWYANKKLQPSLF